MENQKMSQTEIAKKIQACLKEIGIFAEVSVSQHEVIVYGQKEQEGGRLRIVSQISDRTVTPAGQGPVAHEVARAHLGTAMVRPSLSSRSYGQQKKATTEAISEKIGLESES
ncbi:MAG TPA: hypothetical protein VMM16_08435 [Verrucomicrobiae bacterium]|nr:hypothetical protein [Verrucomicrobiae bacterium]